MVMARRPSETHRIERRSRDAATTRWCFLRQRLEHRDALPVPGAGIALMALKRDGGVRIILGQLADFNERQRLADKGFHDALEEKCATD